MSFTSPFQPQGNTLIVASTAASATAGVQVSTGAMQGVRLVNLSTLDAYVSVASSSSATASLPTTASPSTGSMPLLQRTERVLTVGPNFWLSAITSAGQANIAVTGGFGS